MSRTVRALLLSLSVLLLATPASADEYAFGFNPRSGDAWIDAQLGDVNVFARGNLDGFVDEVVVSTGAPADYVRELVVERDWSPGDAYYACLVARELGWPCTRVVEAYEREARGRARGWGALAKEFGIQPGSPAFHALKSGVSQGNGRMRGRGGPADRGPPRGREASGNDRGNGRGNGHGRGG